MTGDQAELKKLNSHLEEARERGEPPEIIAEIEYQRDQVFRSIQQEAMPDPVDEYRARRRRRREERERERQFQRMVLG